MFSWFRQTCPVDFKHKVWIEYRLRFLVQRLGTDRIIVDDVLIPTPNAIPELAPGKTPDIESLSQRLCDHLKIDRSGLTIEVADELPLDNASGVYRQENRSILLRSSLLDEPAQLLATLIHELLHDLLLQGGILTGDESDHEQMTDLAACIVGCGIPLANATIQFQSGYVGGWSWWQTSRSGYLSSPEFGYALALCCWWKEVERPPSWSEYLRLDAREPLQKGLKFLHHTSDSLFRRGSSGGLDIPRESDHQRILRDGSNTEILGTLWDAINEEFFVDGERVCDLLQHAEPQIRCAACDFLTEHHVTEAAGDALSMTTVDPHPEVRASGTYAFVRGYPNYRDAARIVRRSLQDSETGVVRATLSALFDSPKWNDSIEISVLDVLAASVLSNRGVEPEMVLGLLLKKTVDLDHKIRDRLSDPTYAVELATVLQTLRNLRSDTPTQS